MCDLDDHDACGLRDLARSLVYRFLAAAFAYPDAAGAKTLADLGEALGEGLALAHPPLADAVAGEVVASIAAEPPEGHLAAYVRLFGHAVQGPHALYETEYGQKDGGLNQGREIADIAGFYGAAGLRPRSGLHERDDHLALECEFLQVLARKEAHARESGDAAQAESLRELTGAFLATHLGRFGPAFFRRLGAEPGFFGALGRLGEAFLAAELRHAGLPAEGEELALRVPLTGPDEEFRCAPAGADPGVRGVEV